ncbi:MAG: phosphatase PAP2 family protein [Prevotella sp.]|nr:phosphatase PAP2 family protein [Prevotella sp.]MBQ6208169.1 phosphatase PAP2 family protein [Prevotella sp.]
MMEMAGQGGHSLAISDGATNVKPNYKFLDDISWAGIPVFVAGIIAKGEKQAFRQDYRNSHVNTRLVTEFKTSVDDYLQFFSPALTLGLKVGGVEGRSDWLRLMSSAALSYGIMAGFVNGIKYTASEMRPDGSTRNSWPSGHTATAFVGATILHKEYGLTRSPWYSVAGYGAATATGVMRVLNNRHWVSDVLSGAGIGIMSGELAYALSDLIFKDKHLLRGNLSDYPDLNRAHPSFFDVSMGIGFGSRNIEFSGEDMEYGTDDDIKLKFRASTVVQAEGAYFINKFVGLGGRLRVRTSPINGWSNFMKVADNNVNDLIEDFKSYTTDPYFEGVDFGDGIEDIIQTKEFSIESDHLTEFAGDVGLYFNIPLSNRLSLGTKALIGRSIMQSLEIDAHFTGMEKDFNYSMVIDNSELVDLSLNSLKNTGNSYDIEWDYISLKGNNSTKYGTGVSLTYAYHGNFCWKVFCDFDHTRKTYTMTYDPDRYEFSAMPKEEGFANLIGIPTDPYVYEIKKNMNTWVLGASFSVSF